MYQQPKGTWKIILIIILAILVLAEGYFIYRYYSAWKKEKSNNQAIQSQLDTCNKKTTSATKSGASNESCTPTLTDTDLTEMKGWEDLTSTQNYTLLHPASWEVQQNDKDIAILKDNADGADINFRFASGEMTNTDIDPGFSETDKKTIKVACVDATETYYSQGDQRLILVDFEKNATRHLIFFFYNDVGASMTGDILDAFGRILKSITFS